MLDQFELKLLSNFFYGVDFIVIQLILKFIVVIIVNLFNY
jgi:hypothetical protein